MSCTHLHYPVTVNPIISSISQLGHGISSLQYSITKTPTFLIQIYRIIDIGFQPLSGASPSTPVLPNISFPVCVSVCLFFLYYLTTPVVFPKHNPVDCSSTFRLVTSLDNFTMVKIERGNFLCYYESHEPFFSFPLCLFLFFS